MITPTAQTHTLHWYRRTLITFVGARLSGKTRNIAAFLQAAVELIATDCVTKISFASLGLRLAVELDYILKAL